jgi:IS5 family transposase
LVLIVYGLPVEFEITGGEVNDCSAAPDLIASLPDAEVIIADKGYAVSIYGSR